MTSASGRDIFRGSARLLVGILLPASCWSGGLTFDLIATTPNMNQLAVAGFHAAASRWSALFVNDLTVTLDIGFAPLAAGILGSTNSTEVYASYPVVRQQLIADASSSVIDQTSIQHLPAGSIPIWINHTKEHPSATPYLDNNGSFDNSNVLMSTADAKALGFTLPDGITVDGSITFSSSYNWDFDPSNGITAGYYDFVGVATHEIGHALGFISDVDNLDYCAFSSGNCGGTAPFLQNAFSENYIYYLPSTLDLFRYSTASVSHGAIDFTADARVKYFSVDGGTTALAQFSTGVYYGDGRQDSHWKDSLGLGIMDPTGAPGELLAISKNDIEAFDAIGWNLAPEPAPFLLCGAGLAALALRRRRASHWLS